MFSQAWKDSDTQLSIYGYKFKVDRQVRFLARENLEDGD